MATRSALLVGATGVVGGFVLNQLLADSAYGAVTVLTRKALPQAHPKLQQVQVDFERLDEQQPCFAVDDVFCCLGTTMRTAGSKAAFRKVDFDYVVKTAELAAKAGARQFLLVSAVGASARAAAFYSRVKGEAEDTIRALNLPAAHFLRPSLLLGPRAEKRPGETAAKLFAPLLSAITVGPLAKYKPVQAEEVARRMITIAKSGQTGAHVHHLF